MQHELEGMVCVCVCVWNKPEGRYSSLVRVRHRNISKVADPVVPRFRTYPERVVFSETMRPARQDFALVPPGPLLSDQLPVLPCTPRACEWRDEYVWVMAAYYWQVCLDPENGKDVTEGIRSSASTITSFPSSC